MAVNPVKVRLIGQKKEYYQIEFPELPVPVEVSEAIYQRMLHSNEYEFTNGIKRIKMEELKRKSVA